MTKNTSIWPLLLIMLLILSINAQAQRRNSARVRNLERYDVKPYHFGFVLGINQMTFIPHMKDDYRIIDTLYVVQQVPDYGFHIGIVTNLRLHEFADLRFVPSIYFGERRMMYTYQDPRRGVYTEQMKIESNILNFPVLIKYKSARLTNTRAYVIGGAAYNLDLASQSDKKELFGAEHQVKLKRHDFTYELGVGFDFYLSYFKMATELKMQFGLNDMLKKEDDIYTSAIDRLNSKLMILSFTFE